MIGFFRNIGFRSPRDEAEPAALKFRVAPEVKASLHPDGVVLIHLGKGTVFSANRVGALIWSRAAERWSVSRLAAFVSGEFNIAPETAQRDTAAFLEQLKAEGLLVADAN